MFEHKRTNLLALTVSISWYQNLNHAISPPVCFPVRFYSLKCSKIDIPRTQ